MGECKYQNKCDAYKYLVEHSKNPRLQEILEICELENPSDISEKCKIYDLFANPVEFKALNRKPYITRP